MKTLKGHRSPAHVVAFSPEEPLLISAAGAGRRVSLWDLTTGRRRYLRGADAPIVTAAFSPTEGRVVAVTERFGVLVWSSDRLEPIVESGPSILPWGYFLYEPQLCFSPSGETLYLSNLFAGGVFLPPALSTANQEPCIRRLDLPNLKPSAFHGFPIRSVIEMAIASDGTLWCLSPLEVEDWEEARPIRLFEGIRLELARYSPGTSEPETLTIDSVSPEFPNSQEINCRTGRILLARERLIEVIEARDGTVSLRIEMNESAISEVTFLPDGESFLVASLDGVVRHFDAGTGELITQWDFAIGQLAEISCSPDGRFAAVAGSSDITVWDLDF